MAQDKPVAARWTGWRLSRKQSLAMKDSMVGFASSLPHSFIVSTDSVAGPSSNIAFMRTVTGATGAILGVQGNLLPSSRQRKSPPHLPSPVSPVIAKSPSSSLKSTETSCLALPPDTKALHLLESYFALPGTMFPFIHKHHVMSHYSQARGRTDKGVRRSLLALLNALFANVLYANAGQQSSVSPQEDIADSEIFFSRAEKLLSNEHSTIQTLETGMLHVMAHADTMH